MASVTLNTGENNLTQCEKADLADAGSVTFLLRMSDPYVLPLRTNGSDASYTILPGIISSFGVQGKPSQQDISQFCDSREPYCNILLCLILTESTAIIIRLPTEKGSCNFFLFIHFAHNIYFQTFTATSLVISPFKHGPTDKQNLFQDNHQHSCSFTIHSGLASLCLYHSAGPHQIGKKKGNFPSETLADTEGMLQIKIKYTHCTFIMLKNWLTLSFSKGHLETSSFQKKTNLKKTTKKS